jgi:hypothetical protein
MTAAPWMSKMNEIPRELLVPVLYTRMCPACRAFTKQATIAEGEDRILKCTVCGSSERFILKGGHLIGEGTYAEMHRFIMRRAKEALNAD